MGIFVGLALIVVGLIPLLERLGVLPFGLREAWPAFLVALGLALVIEALRRR